MRLKTQSEQDAKSIGRISMEHHPNRNGFNWKRMKPTACITVQYKNVTMIDFKVKEGAENMLIISTIGSFILMKSLIHKR